MLVSRAFATFSTADSANTHTNTPCVFIIYKLNSQSESGTVERIQPLEQADPAPGPPAMRPLGRLEAVVRPLCLRSGGGPPLQGCCGLKKALHLKHIGLEQPLRAGSWLHSSQPSGLEHVTSSLRASVFLFVKGGRYWEGSVRQGVIWAQQRARHGINMQRTRLLFSVWWFHECI